MKKIFYVPGIISLLIVPWMFIKKMEKENNAPRQVSIRFFMPNCHKKYNPKKMEYSEGWVMHNLRQRKLIKITLDGRLDDKEKKFELIKYEARKLKYTYDVIHVLAIRLTDENTFGDFVRLINLCQADHHKRYTFMGDVFYIFGEDKNGGYPN